MRMTLFLLLTMLCGGVIASAQVNLIANPSFEEAPAKDGLPGGGWWLSQSMGDTRVKVDRTKAHSGQASVRMESSAEEKCVLVSRKFEVAPGDGLRFEAWLRGENLPASRNTAYAGLVFRQADGRVMERHYFSSGALSGEWSMISGAAQAPMEAATAEVHLGYTNGPGTLCCDDVSAVITNTISFSLLDDAKPWPGTQEITMRVANRQTTEFRGNVSTTISKVATSVPVVVGAKSSRDFKTPITLNGVGQHAYKISLLDGNGTALNVIQGKFKTAAALVLYPPCPCYHLAGSGNGDTLIDARVNIDPAQRMAMNLSVTVLEAGGRERQPWKVPVSQSDMTELHVSVPVSVPGVFDITARLIDGAGREIATAQSDVHVIAPDQAQVKVGPDGFLRADGKPEFPIGLYNAWRDTELAQAGFNATHNYNISTGDAAATINPTDTQLKELLDNASNNGLRMMIELPRKAIEKGQWVQVQHRIETFCHHPGLLCWGSEERVARGLTSPANIAALYALVRKLDPDHPLVLGDTRDVIEKLQVDRRDFFPDESMDVGIWWWYPIPIRTAATNALEGGGESGDLLEPPGWLTTTHSKKPLWIAIQAYQKPSRDARFPTPAEYRCQAYLSIINGVKGLYFYCGSGQRDYAGKPSGILNKPEEGHWEYVKQLAGELRDFSPVIMAGPAAMKLQLTPAGTPVEFATRELDGKIYLIAANKSGLPQKPTWQGELLRARKATVLFEEHAAKVQGDSLADDFPAYAVHVYRFEQP
jgi:hypothetical protein